MPVYYKEHVKYERFMTENDLAELFSVYSLEGKPYGKLVRCVLEDAKVEPYFYCTSSGMMRAYAMEDYLEPMQNLIKITDHKEGKFIYASKKNKYLFLKESKRKIV